MGAEAEPYYGYGGYGGYRGGYGGYGGYGYSRGYYGKREADAEPEAAAKPYYGYYGKREAEAEPYYGYGGYGGYRGGTEAMVDTATAGATTESVRLMPSLRLLPSPTTATEDMEATGVDTEATVDTATAGATMASVKPRLSPTMAMEVMVDTVATEATEATKVTVMATASNLFPDSFDESYFAQP